MLKKVSQSVSNTAVTIGDGVQKATHKPKTKDEEFEQLRDRFKTYKDSVEKIKKEAVKLQDDTRTYAKCHKNLGEELDSMFVVMKDESGKKYKTWAVSFDTASQELQAGIGEVIAGTEVLINICAGLERRIRNRDDITMDMEIADKHRDKGAKEMQKFEEAKQKFEEVNTRLKTDLAVALKDGHPRFRGHYEKLIAAQHQAFRHMSEASQELL